MLAFNLTMQRKIFAAKVKSELPYITTNLNIEQHFTSQYTDKAIREYAVMTEGTFVACARITSVESSALIYTVAWWCNASNFTDLKI
jgi:hypothetical protein